MSKKLALLKLALMLFAINAVFAVDPVDGSGVQEPFYTVPNNVAVINVNSFVKSLYFNTHNTGKKAQTTRLLFLLSEKDRTLSNCKKAADLFEKMLYVYAPKFVEAIEYTEEKQRAGFIYLASKTLKEFPDIDGYNFTRLIQLLNLLPEKDRTLPNCRTAASFFKAVHWSSTGGDDVFEMSATVTDTLIETIADVEAKHIMNFINLVNKFLTNSPGMPFTMSNAFYTVKLLSLIHPKDQNEDNFKTAIGLIKNISWVHNIDPVFIETIADVEAKHIMNFINLVNKILAEFTSMDRYRKASTIELLTLLPEADRSEKSFRAAARLMGRISDPNMGFVFESIASIIPSKRVDAIIKTGSLATKLSTTDDAIFTIIDKCK